MLIDDIRIKIKAGDGGDGIVHFYSDRWRPKGGPDGGDGGKGGDIYAQAVSDFSKLSQFRHTKEFSAENGKNGGAKQSTGRGGDDLTLEFPVGSIIRYDNGTTIELAYVGQKEILAKGGKGGIGNYRYRSATNQAPTEFKAGEKKDWRNLHIQLKLIADIGLIGLPNTGKTSLLNELTSASAKVANYAFTTLEPNLGVTKGNHIIADIPGLIEGASLGKGLGVKFLQHIERTRFLIHCISCESDDIARDYQIIRHELSSYSSKLDKKHEIIILTKSDLVSDPKKLQQMKKSINAKLTVSIIDEASIKALNDLIALLLSPVLP